MDSVADAAEGPASGWGFPLSSRTEWSKNALAKLCDANVGITTMGQAVCRLGA